MRPTGGVALDNAYPQLVTVSSGESRNVGRRCPHSPPHQRPCLSGISQCSRVWLGHRRTQCQRLQCQATLAEVLAFIPGVCFDRQCQEAADRAFLIVTTVPLLGLLAAIILKLRPVSTEKLNSEQVATSHSSAFAWSIKAKLIQQSITPCASQQVFDDPATGVYFQSPDGSVPERDRKGELAFRPVSYTPWPVEAGTPGERLRIDVGPASCTSPRTFVFDRWC